MARRVDQQKPGAHPRGLVGRYSRRTDGFSVPHAHVWFDTDDGVRLAGSMLEQAGGDTAVVLVHGFNGYRTKPKVKILAEGIARRFPLLAFDLRGHGESGGACTGGERESLDVHSAVQFARRRGYKRVVTVGASLGGIAVILEAAHHADVDGVVAISTPSQWGLTDTKAIRRMTWVFTTPLGRGVVRRLYGTRIDLNWGNPESPLEVVSRISAPLVIVHGADDHFFHQREAEALYERASEPKRLLIIERFGHAEDGFTPAFAAQVCEEIAGLLSGEPEPKIASDSGVS